MTDIFDYKACFSLLNFNIADFVPLYPINAWTYNSYGRLVRNRLPPLSPLVELCIYAVTLRFPSSCRISKSEINETKWAISGQSSYSYRSVHMLSGQLSGQTRSMIFSWPDPDTEKKRIQIPLSYYRYFKTIFNDIFSFLIFWRYSWFIFFRNRIQRNLQSAKTPDPKPCICRYVQSFQKGANGLDCILPIFFFHAFCVCKGVQIHCLYLSKPKYFSLFNDGKNNFKYRLFSYRCLFRKKNMYLFAFRSTWWRPTCHPTCPQPTSPPTDCSMSRSSTPCSGSSGWSKDLSGKLGNAKYPICFREGGDYCFIKMSSLYKK